jgi:hypothetical protein
MGRVEWKALASLPGEVAPLAGHSPPHPVGMPFISLESYDVACVLSWRER